MRRNEIRQVRHELQGLTPQLLGRPVTEARWEVHAIGGTLHDISQPGPRRLPTRLCVRVADGRVARVLSIG